MSAENIPEGFVSELATVNGITLHYVRGGEGPPLILIHGFPQDWFEYHAIMPRLAKRFTVIVVDLRGIGRSTSTQGGYDAANMAEDVYQLVSTLKLERVYIVGHDIGGMVTYAFVRRYPRSTRGAMILDQVIPGIEGWEEVQGSPAVWHMHSCRFQVFPRNLSLDAKLTTSATFLTSANSGRVKWPTLSRPMPPPNSLARHLRCTALFLPMCNSIRRNAVQMKCHCS
jgi:pimeloyl-ACP methyl ester carboxylesterase